MDDGEPHPLDGCDEAECYRIMMAERTELIKARRETEDNFIKTIVQLSAALLVLIVGYVIELGSGFSGWRLFFASFALLLLVAAVMLGIFEQYFSSKAYLSQQQQMEAYYQRQTTVFSEPRENACVRRAQISAFICFVLSLLLLVALAILTMGPFYEQQSATATATATATAAPATATASSPPATAASSPAAAGAGSSVGGRDEIGSTVDAATTS
jgi:uncharacterized protein (UPF0333 family)